MWWDEEDLATIAMVAFVAGVVVLDDKEAH